MSLGLRWNLVETDANLSLMSQVLGIKEATASVMANRGIRSKNAAKAYLQAGLAGQKNSQTNILDSRNGMKDARKAFDRIIKGIRQRERVMIYGDYDADGVMSTVILYKALKSCGADVYFYIPHREEEGYGLNLNAVRAIKEDDHDLLITCDNGISSLAEIAEAQNLGMDVIVIDHHEPGFVGEDTGLTQGQNEGHYKRHDVIPEALAVIDPKQAACPYPFKEMCAAGLSFRLMESFYQYIGRDFSHLYNELLALASIATICDIVDLLGENRAIVKQGLMVLNANKGLNGGLSKLIALKGYMEKPIDTFTVGFVLGPCINATGRLESAEMSVQLLLSNNEEEQTELARTLIGLNEERKAITNRCVDRALKKITALEDKVIVLVDEETHESIAGIVAGKIKETIHRPTIVLTRSTDTGILKGSGRSIEKYNLFEALYANRDLFLRFGGHAMAAGMTLEEEKVEELYARLNKACTLQDSDFQGIIQIDRELDPEEITLELAKELEWLAPFGKGNREPLFLTRNLSLTALRVINEKNTLIFTFGNLKGIAFGLNDVFSGRAGDNMDLVHTVETNTFGGRTSVQIRIRDFKIIGS